MFFVAFVGNVDLHLGDTVDVIVAFIIQRTSQSNTFFAGIAFLSIINTAVDGKVVPPLLPFFVSCDGILE